MSILSVVSVPEGIAMAADSRYTRTVTQNGEKTTFTLSDNGQKVMLLSKTPVGIAFCGNVMIRGKTVSDYIRLFEIRDIQQGDTPEIVARKLHDRCGEFPDTTFYVCGYSRDVPYVYILTGGNLVRRNVNNKNQLMYSAFWAGEKTALTKLINGQPAMVIDTGSMPLKDGIDLAEFMIDMTIKYQRFADQIATCGGPIDVLVLTKDQAFWHKHKLYAK